MPLLLRIMSLRIERLHRDVPVLMSSVFGLTHSRIGKALLMMSPVAPSWLYSMRMQGLIWHVTAEYAIRCEPRPLLSFTSKSPK